MSADADTGKLAVAFALIAGFMVIEVGAGVIAHSLALLSDAGHMLTDSGAIGLSLLAARLVRRPPGGVLTFGLKRMEVLSAQLNGATLLILAVLIVYEAIHRLIAPPHVQAELILAVALFGTLVNVAASWTLARADRERLNVEGSFQHVLNDLWAFIGTAVAAGVILATGFERADPIISLLIAYLMARSGYSLIKASGRVFLEAAPEGFDPDRIGQALTHATGVVEVHDLHVWEITSGLPSLSAHVLVGQRDDCHATRRELEQILRDCFHVQHTTLQVDHLPAELLQIEAPPSASTAPG